MTISLLLCALYNYLESDCILWAFCYLEIGTFKGACRAIAMFMLGNVYVGFIRHILELNKSLKKAEAEAHATAA